MKTLTLPSKPVVINAENIHAESYYNVIQLARITRYANPIAALNQTQQTVRVERDACGNIVSGSFAA